MIDGCCGYDKGYSHVYGMSNGLADSLANCQLMAMLAGVALNKYVV